MNNTFYIKKSQINDNVAFIDGADFHHIKDVLRVKTGENVNICDEDGNKYKAQLIEYKDKEAWFSLFIDYAQEEVESKVDITLFQGLPKQDKMEYIIQKGTELGVSEIVPVKMDNCVVKLDDKGFQKKSERWQKIAKEASSQCGRHKIPAILEPINFQNIIENITKYDIVLLPYENEQEVSIKDVLRACDKPSKVAVIIGPEGGFSKAEIDYISNYPKVRLVSLGKRILRTETASLAVLSMLSYELEL